MGALNCRSVDATRVGAARDAAARGRPPYGRARRVPPPRVRGAGCLLRVLTGAGSSAETAVVRRLNTVDARMLRAAHPRLVTAVAAADWAWDGVVAMLYLHHPRAAARAAARFAAALPRAACGIGISFSPNTLMARTAYACAWPVVAALPRSLRSVTIQVGGFTRDTHEFLVALCDRFTDLRALDVDYNTLLTLDVIAALPPRLACLRAHFARLPHGMRLAHLAALHTLVVTHTAFDDAALAATPPALRALGAVRTRLTAAARFDHLPCLRALNVSHTEVGDAALASLQPHTAWLDASYTPLTAAARFGHLRRLRVLFVFRTRIADAALASVPPRLVHLDAAFTALTDGARFDHLPRLRELSVSFTHVGAAAAASVPRRLAELQSEGSDIPRGVRARAAL